MAAVAAVLAVVAGVGAGVTVLWPRSDHPDHWDPRVIDLVAFVESERGLRFEHPVHIDFLPDDEFRRLVTEPDEDSAADGDALADDSMEAMLRAVGFITEDLDLATVGEELHGDGIAGVYLFDEKRIAVRGETLDDQRRLTLVHELTHALQDQHFDLGSMEQYTSGEAAAFTAVVEADATMVEDAWFDSLPVAAREALMDAEEATAAGADFAGVPEVFLELTGFPYFLGPRFLERIIDERGAEGRNQLMRDLPTTEEHILLPQTYLDGQTARSVPVAALGRGERAIPGSESDFGMLSLLILLGERLDFSDAWGAVQGWAGDAAIGFERDGRSCVRMKVFFDDPSQAARFGEAVVRWGAGLPVKADVTGHAATVESCDPGPRPGRAEGHLSGIQGFGLRSDLIAALSESGVPATAAPCVVDGVLGRLGADRYVVLDTEAAERPTGKAARELERAFTAVAETCRA